MHNKKYNLYGRTLILLCVLLALPLSVYYPQAASPFHSDREREAFASFLYAKSDYLRARYELEALSAGFMNDTLRFRLAYSCIRTNDFPSAISHIPRFKDTSASKEIRRCLLKNLFDAGEYTQIIAYCSEANGETSVFSREALPLVSVAKLLTGNERSYSKYSFETVSGGDRTALLELQKEIISPSKKSVWGAALLSAAVPGLGKLYTGKTGDGITAAIVTGLLGFLAVDNFNNQHTFRGYVFSITGAVFYAGTIYGSAASAQIVNEENMQDARTRLSDYVKARNCFLEPASFSAGGSK